MKNEQFKPNFKPDLEKDARDAQMIKNQRDKENEAGLRIFNQNVKQIQLGQRYSVEDLEVIFDVRFGEQLRNNLINRFEFTANKDGTFTFTKEKQV